MKTRKKMNSNKEMLQNANKENTIKLKTYNIDKDTNILDINLMWY